MSGALQTLYSLLLVSCFIVTIKPSQGHIVTIEHLL